MRILEQVQSNDLLYFRSDSHADTCCIGHNYLIIYDLNRTVCIYGYDPVIEYKSDEFKEVKWIINSIKSQLDSVNNCEADTDDGKDPDSSDKEVNHDKRQSYYKVNPALTRRWGLINKNRP